VKLRCFWSLWQRAFSEQFQRSWRSTAAALKHLLASGQRAGARRMDVSKEAETSMRRCDALAVPGPVGDHLMV